MNNYPTEQHDQYCSVFHPSKDDQLTLNTDQGENKVGVMFYINGFNLAL